MTLQPVLGVFAERGRLSPAEGREFCVRDCRTEAAKTRANPRVGQLLLQSARKRRFLTDALLQSSVWLWYASAWRLRKIILSITSTCDVLASARNEWL